jgi:2-polyprenyl-3-methyl-5-hydroxy-6-metoxy-1,4-benzoquinol methylase/glycosyltransferase involved in cell wall biosynthesis
MQTNLVTTRIGNFQTITVSRNLDGNPKSTDITIVESVGNNKRVLELGCASGHMSQVFRSNGCSVVGVEINPAAADLAAAACERVIVADLDYMDFDQELGSDRFDVIVAADVLEHLKDPECVLRALKKFLTPAGYLVTSIPNIAHLSVRLALLSGRFPYGDGGLLDRTHLRFFTRQTAEELLENSGFAVGHVERIENIPLDPSLFEVPYDPRAVPAAVMEALAQDPEASTYQFVVVSYPMPRAGLTLIQQRMKDLARLSEDTLAEATQLRAQLDHAIGENGALQELLEQRTAEIGDLDARHEAMTARAAAAESELVELRHEAQTVRAEFAALQDELARHNSSRIHAEQAAESMRAQEAARSERIVQLVQAHEIECRNTADLRVTVEGLKKRNAELSAQVETLLGREKDLREMLFDAHDQLMRRDEEIASTLATVLPPRPATDATPTRTAFSPQTLPGKFLVYQQLLQKIREVVGSAVPQSSKVLVISKGDDEMLKLQTCKGQHFPQTADGVYSGHHPADGGVAIQHLEQLRSAGSEFLLIPQTSMWWLDHYRDLKDHLDSRFPRVVDQPDICVVFDLTRAKPQQVSAGIFRQVEVIPSPRPFGVNVSGHLASEKGVGEAVRSQVRSLRSIGVPVELNNVPDDTAVNLESEFTSFSDDNPYSVNLIHLNADSLEYFAEQKRKEYFQGHYNIGYWAWETPAFPRQWWDRFQSLDEIWVGSDFVLDAVSRVSSIPVVKVLLAIPDRAALIRLPRSHFGLSNETFVFLFIFDFMSVFERKNPLGLVEAFRKAFRKRDDVTLVLKCLHSDRHEDEMQALKQACRGLNVKIIDELFTRQETTSLMAAANCYVSLHRSEGFGLTMAEAMSLEKPVIATAFSGNMEFMSPANSYLVKYTLVEIDKSYGPYEKSLWADPDVAHAAELMRQVFKNRAEAAETGRRARLDILNRLNQKRLGTLMRDRLLRIAELGKIAAPTDQQFLEVTTNAGHAKDGLYQNLVARIRTVVREKIQPDACIAVISKGDDEVVRFQAHCGWHFPQTSDGTYAGYHPTDAPEAIALLEQVRGKGGQYLLFPQTAFWWLDHYTGFRSHLDNQYQRVWSDPDCIIYKLSGTNGSQQPQPASVRASRARKVRRTLGHR